MCSSPSSVDQELIDPDSICGVVLDEAQHCAKEHPFGRVARSFLTVETAPSAPARPKSASELPKVSALVHVCRAKAVLFF